LHQPHGYIYQQQSTVPGHCLAGDWDRLTHLIQSQCRLRTIHIDGPRKEATTAFWASLTSCTHVLFQNLVLTAEHVRALWDGCRNLQELGTSSIHVFDTRHFYGEAGLHPHLKRLTFSTAFGTDVATEALAILTKCPNLAEFTVTCNWYRPCQALAPLIHVLEQGHLLQLKSLNLTGAVEDCELAACLSAMTQARKFNFESTYFGVQAFPTLVPHFATLETPQWSMCAHVSGEMSQTVLESCPLLRVSVRRGSRRGWSSRGGHLYEQSRAVFGQIERVTAQEELSIGREWPQPPEPVQGLDLRLRGGMGLLGELKQLRRFEHRDTVQQMGSELG
ncbi:hypothetical protein BG000_011935, partial [Podila horticola]